MLDPGSEAGMTVFGLGMMLFEGGMNGWILIDSGHVLRIDRGEWKSNWQKL